MTFFHVVNDDYADYALEAKESDVCPEKFLECQARKKAQLDKLNSQNNGNPAVGAGKTPNENRPIGENTQMSPNSSAVVGNGTQGEVKKLEYDISGATSLHRCVERFKRQTWVYMYVTFVVIVLTILSD